MFESSRAHHLRISQTYFAAILAVLCINSHLFYSYFEVLSAQRNAKSGGIGWKAFGHSIEKTAS